MRIDRIGHQSKNDDTNNYNDTQAEVVQRLNALAHIGNARPHIEIESPGSMRQPQ